MRWLRCYAGCLGTFLEDFLEAGPEAVECLSPMEKAAMIAVARRRVSFY